MAIILIECIVEVLKIGIWVCKAGVFTPEPQLHQYTSCNNWNIVTTGASTHHRNVADWMEAPRNTITWARPTQPWRLCANHCDTPLKPNKPNDECSVFMVVNTSTGSSDDIRPSSVTQNAFHNGFNTAIGVFGASNLTVSGNVVHHTVGPGIRVEGENIKYSSRWMHSIRRW